MDDDNEYRPITSGLLTTQLSGDNHTARTHLQLGRKMLDKMRNQHGVPGREAAGESGGYFRSHAKLEDGSIVTVITNNGNNLIRIHTPPRAESVTPPEVNLAHTPESSEATLAGQGTDSFDITRPHEEKSEPRPEEETKPTEEQRYPTPYMWVGIRIKLEEGTSNRIGEPDMPERTVLAYMVEPEAEERERGIIATATYDRLVQADLSEEEPELNMSLSTALGQFQQVWGSVPDGGIPETVHNLRFVDTSTPVREYFNFSTNGLRCYGAGAWLTVPEGEPPEVYQFAPYDPSLPADEQDRDRDFNDAVYGDVYTQARMGRPPWDIVYVLDPEEEDGTDPSDPRELNRKARLVLEEAGMASFDDVVLKGEYVLHLAANASPYKITDRGGRTGIPIADLNPDYFFRTNDSDYQEHLFYPLAPLQLEVEVRLNKEPFTDTFFFEITLEHYGGLQMNTLPYGDHLNNGCPGYSGGNPRSQNWNEFDILIDVEAGNCRTGLDDSVGMFNGSAPSNEWNERYYDLDIYVSTTAGISYGEMTAVNFTAKTIHDILERMTAGYYGLTSTYMVERDQSAIAGAIFAGDAAFGTPEALAQIYLYSVASNTFTPKPNLPDPEQPPEGSEETPLNENYFWFYPYASDSKENCRYPLGVLLVGPAVLNGALPYYGEPEIDPHLCC